MSDAVKRVYTSELRAAQALQTRQAIVSAAARLFVDAGWGATTVDDIAAAAGVSRRTVFASVGGKVDILKLALDWAVAGDEEPVALADRPEILALHRQEDPATLLREWVRMLTTIDIRAAGLTVALAVAAETDAEARKLWTTAQAQRLSGAEAIVQTLKALNGLRDDLSLAQATDLAWLYSDPVMYHRLVIDRGWSNKHYETWLVQTLSHQLLRAGTGRRSDR